MFGGFSLANIVWLCGVTVEFLLIGICGGQKQLFGWAS